MERIAVVAALVLCLLITRLRMCSCTLHLPADYPQLPPGPPIIPPAYRNYFSMDGATQELIRNIAGPGFLPEDFFDYPPFRTTPAPTWTRPTTPKDELVSYFERAMDHWLSGGYEPRNRLPLPTSRLTAKPNVFDVKPNVLDSNAIEADALLFSKDEKSSKTMVKQNDEIEEGSGFEESIPTEKKPSSIAGIPNVYPNISKVPLNFGITKKELLTENEEQSMLTGFKSRPDVPQGGFGPLAEERDIRRHPGKNRYEKENVAYSLKSVDQFQYDKPTYKQGFMSSMLNFLGLPQVGEQTSELDHAITSWLLHHSPTYTTRAERLANVPSGYSSFQKFISQSMTPLCTPQPNSVKNFNVHAFMGQWFQVMHSPLMSSSSCSMMSYKLLTDTPNGVGSVFQTLEYSVSRTDERRRADNERATMTSGHAVVIRPGQIVYRKSNSPEDAIVHVIHVGDSPTLNDRYEYAVLSINCNYPLYVIARDPAVFEQRYARTVNAYLQREGIINKVSRFFNIVKPADFSQCRLPPTFFGNI